VLGVTALGSALDLAQGPLPAASDREGTPGGAAAAPTGETTTIAASMADLRCSPDVLEVPAGTTLVIELRNDDPSDVHDLVLADGTTSGRLSPGQSATVESGVITQDLEGWCSIVGHRAMGMTLRVHALGGSGDDAASPEATGADALARIPLDLQQAPGPDHVRRDALLPASAGASQRLTLEVRDVAAEIAPGL